MKTLLLYPHGLGDCILATPLLRTLHKRGDEVGFATLERFRSARLLDNCPYVQELFYTKDAWNDFPSFEVGMQHLAQVCLHWIKERGYQLFVPVKHGPKEHKIIANYLRVGIDPFGPDFDESLQTEVWITPEDEEAAKRYKPEQPYAFIQTRTGVPAKDLPIGFGQAYARNHGIPDFVEVGISFRYDEIPIGAQFALLRDASMVIIPDSVFFHAACALGKAIDFVYFARGRGIHDRVHPLEGPHKYNPVYQLPSEIPNFTWEKP